MNNKCISLDDPRFRKLEDFIAETCETDTARGREASLINVLHEAQKLFSHIPPPVQEFVAGKLRMPTGRVFSVLSFYNHFSTSPQGRFQIRLCFGTACFIRGADEILKQFEKKLGIATGKTTEDGTFSLDALRCVGMCSLAPVVMVNEMIYQSVTPSQVEDIIEHCTSDNLLE